MDDERSRDAHHPGEPALMTRDEWEREVLAPAIAHTAERRFSFTTSSGHPIRAAYAPDDVAEVVYGRDLGDPGSFPFTRGVRAATADPAAAWTMHALVAGATPAEANAHIRGLIASGAGGVNILFDLPTLMGRDPDAETAGGEVGRDGVSIATVEDMVEMFDDVPIDAVTVSMTSGSVGPVLLAMYCAAADARGVPRDALRGTTGSDVWSERIAGAEGAFAPDAALRLTADTMVFTDRALAAWMPVKIAGDRIRHAGADAAGELASVLAIGVDYVQRAVAAGCPADVIAPRLLFSLGISSDFFEEVARLRAARQAWARIMQRRFGLGAERACAMRLHAETCAAPEAEQSGGDGAVRTALQALAAVLGGAGSLAAGGWAVPAASSEAMLALRTQQVLAHETGLAGKADPLGGAWWLERLTQDLATQALANVDQIFEAGGVAAALASGAIPSCRAEVTGPRRAKERGAGPSAAASRRAHLEAARRRRNAADVERCLALLAQAAASSANVMEPLIASARALATLGEMCDVLRSAGDAARREQLS